MTRKFYTGIFFIIHLCLGCESKFALPEITCTTNLTEGYTDKISYLPGDTVKVYLHASRPLKNCSLTIFNVTGDSIFSVASPLPFHSKYPWGKGATDGFDYPVTAWFIMPELQSGMYLIAKKIPVILKTNKPVDLTVIYPSNTAAAYSFSGGKNLYSPKTYQVSFQRPIDVQVYSKNCLTWLATQRGFSVGYIADVDLENFESISRSRIISVIGHSEYWTRAARTNFDRFVDSGKHALVFSGNTMWWQARYSADKSKLICYRIAEEDPFSDSTQRTVEWNNVSVAYPVMKSIGADFARGGYGKVKDSGWDGYRIIRENSPLLEGTGLKNNDIISLPTLEYDGTLLKGFDAHNHPIMDVQALGFFRGEIIGFDKAVREVETVPTFIVFQKNELSGVIVNSASTEWCGPEGMGGSSAEVIKKITHNAITKLLENKPVFSDYPLNSPRP